MSPLDFIIRQIRQTRIFPNCPSEQAHTPTISVKELTMNDVRIPSSIIRKKKQQNKTNRSSLKENCHKGKE